MPRVIEIKRVCRYVSPYGIPVDAWKQVVKQKILDEKMLTSMINSLNSKNQKS